MTGVPANTYNPYFTPTHLMPTILGPADPNGQLAPCHTQAVPVAQQKIPRSDRLEVSVVLHSIQFGSVSYQRDLLRVS